jgi:hypothetical protein
MPADGATAASSPPETSACPGLGSRPRIHRLRLAPEVRRCGFVQLSKMIVDRCVRTLSITSATPVSRVAKKLRNFCDAFGREYNFNDTVTLGSFFLISLYLRRRCGREGLDQEVRKQGTRSSRRLLREPRGGRDQNHYGLNQEPNRRHDETGLGPG